MGINRARDMQVFAQVAEAGSFSAAARELRLTPSAVSRVIGRLENRLGVRLVQRTTHALTLTAEGEAYRLASLRLTEQIEEAESALTNSEPLGRLRVSASVPFATGHVLPLIPEFLDRYPGVTLDLSLSDRVVDLLEDRTDVAIRAGPLPDSSLTARKLGASRHVVVGSPDYLRRRGTPQTSHDLLAHNRLGFSFQRRLNVWPFDDRGRPLKHVVRGNLLVDDGEALRRLAVSGVGLARLAVFHALDDLKAGRLVPVLEAFNPGDSEPVHALFYGRALTARRVRAFIDFLSRRLDLATAWATLDA